MQDFPLTSSFRMKTPMTLILTAFVGLQMTAISNFKPEATKFIPEGEKFAQTPSDLCSQVDDQILHL